MCCSEGLVRALVFAGNFALGLIGIVLLSLGACYTIQLNQYQLLIPADYETLKFLPVYAMIVGAVAFLMSFWGCWGTLKSNTSLLTSYAAILVVFFILQQGLALFALLHVKNEDDLHQQLEQRLDIVFSKYNQTDEDTTAVNSIQANLECCGTTSPKWWSSVGLEVSPSCYGKSQQAEAFGQGCIQALLAFIVRFAKLTAIIALSVSAVDVVGAVVALYLIKCVKARQIRKVYY